MVSRSMKRISPSVRSAISIADYLLRDSFRFSFVHVEEFVLIFKFLSNDQKEVPYFLILKFYRLIMLTV